MSEQLAPIPYPTASSRAVTEHAQRHPGSRELGFP